MDEYIPITRLDSIPITRLDDIPITILDDINPTSGTVLVNETSGEIFLQMNISIDRMNNNF